MEVKNLTFAMIKPDAVAQKDSGKIIDMIEKNGFEIVRLHKAIVAKDLAEEFYAEHKEKPFFNELVEFVISNPVLIMALYKENAINEWRQLIGATNPKDAAPGTIRHAFGTDIGKNAVHGSLDSESAVRELELFFPEMFGFLENDLSAEALAEEDKSCGCDENCCDCDDDSCNG